MVRQAMKKNFRCLVLSDTHGDMHVLREAIEKEKPFDTLVHCGDVEGSLGSVLGVQTFGYLAVRGNCDLVSDVPRELLFNLGGSRIFVTHGHRFQVRYDVQPLIRQGGDLLVIGLPEGRLKNMTFLYIGGTTAGMCCIESLKCALTIT